VNTCGENETIVEQYSHVQILSHGVTRQRRPPAHQRKIVFSIAQVGQVVRGSS